MTATKWCGRCLRGSDMHHLLHDLLGCFGLIQVFRHLLDFLGILACQFLIHQIHEARIFSFCLFVSGKSAVYPLNGFINRMNRFQFAASIKDGIFIIPVKGCEFRFFENLRIVLFEFVVSMLELTILPKGTLHQFRHTPCHGVFYRIDKRGKGQ